MNPKDEAGSKKTPLRYVPPALMIEASGPMSEGARKYGAFNWRSGDRICVSLYLEAIDRHLSAYKDGEDNDPETGFSHLAHAAATLGIILDSKAIGNLADDRHKGPAPQLLSDRSDIPDIEWDIHFKTDENYMSHQASRQVSPSNPTVTGTTSNVPPPEDRLPMEKGDWKDIPI